MFSVNDYIIKIWQIQSQNQVGFLFLLLLNVIFRARMLFDILISIK